MEAIEFSVSNVLRQKIKRCRTCLAGPLASLGQSAGRVALGGGRPRPDSRPNGSGGGQHPGRPRPGRRPSGSGGGRPPGRPRPGSRPAALFALREDPWPATRPGTLHSPTAPFWSHLFKGFLPQINPNLFANFLSYFSPPLLTLLSLVISQSLQ